MSKKRARFRLQPLGPCPYLAPMTDSKALSDQYVATRIALDTLLELIEDAAPGYGDPFSALRALQAAAVGRFEAPPVPRATTFENALDRHERPTLVDGLKN